MKTSELTRAALNWAVAEALGGKIPQGTGTLPNQWAWYEKFAPSTNWSHGGPIIERCGIATARVKAIKSWHWTAGFSLPSKNPSYGNTPLIAAMRCYVASKLGEEVEIPEELK